MKTEAEHLRELIEILAQAHSLATDLAKSPRDYYNVRFKFTDAMRRATVQAESLNFYRNQRGWGVIALTLDQASKVLIQPNQWAQTARLLDLLRDKVQILANRRLN